MEQDAIIKKVLNEAQFIIYTNEIKIERDGREKYNMKIIRLELALDSIQSVQYDLANEAFYTLLIENHDNYHGKPDVYRFSTNGQVQYVTPFRSLPLHKQFKAIAKPLHTGEIMGLPSILIYFTASLIGCSLPVTGFIIWWKKLA